jgi:lipoprotein-anchoring transpeptidase ErfK/SrfK
MGRTRAALYGLACAFVAAVTPAAAFTLYDPSSTGSVYGATSAYGSAYGSSSAYGSTYGYGGYGYEPDYQTDEAFRAQAAPIPRQLVEFRGRFGPGTIVISTEERRLYYVLGNGQAIQYGIGVGRPGFAWSGTKTITMKREWPDWRPPAEMLRRRPDLPRYMAGGVENPLGARAMYLSGSLYRIHGSNEPETIGQAVSSGCIRMTNEDVTDLYERVKLGTRVVVLR